MAHSGITNYTSGMTITRAMTISFILAATLPSCSGCEDKDDETQIRQLFNYAADIAQKKDIGELMDLTTEDFKVARHGLDRQSVKGVLLMAFRRYGTFTIEHPRPDVDLGPADGEATASAPFLIVRQGKEAPDLRDLYEDPQGWIESVGEMADLYNIELWLVKTDDGWKVEKARLDGYRRLESI